MLLLVGALLGMALGAGAATAAPLLVYSVNTTSFENDWDTTCPCPDPGPDGRLSLREAVAELASDGSSNDRIDLPAGHFVLGGPLNMPNPSSSKIVTIAGAGARATTIDGNGATRIVGSGGKIALGLRHLRLTGGVISTGQGGAVLNHGGSLALDHVLLDHNTARDGGGAVSSAGTLSVTASLFEDNATSTPGNRTSFSSGGDGGAILSTTGPAEIDRSTFVGNVAGGSSSGAGAAGGAIEVSGDSFLLRFDTFSGNNALKDVAGPGPAAEGGNFATNLGVSGTTSNVIMAGGAPANCGGGILGSGDGSIATDTSCGFARVADPLLGPLADNGGETDTEMPGAGSPAIDTATTCIPPPGNLDQRDVPTPQPAGGRCDVGAVEVAPATLLGGGSSGGSGGPGSAAALHGLSVRPSRFRAAASGGSLLRVSAARKKKVAIGTTVRFTLSKASGVNFTVRRPVRGHRKGRRCVAGAVRKPKPGHRRARACTLFKRQGGFTGPGAAGQDRLRFSGRVNGHKLRPGVYQLVGLPAGAPARAAATARFTVLR